ncbi:MAG: 3-hydroxyacyl-CoA dehydrogenase [Candidatus Bathyarchaeota archaeon]|nr:MAG: 3-hydroxyacyl-CoA dehydrogenase [Candidatus Bathyarchaeota archaeon]
MKIENIKAVGVVGAGTMGHGIAQTCSQAGYLVYLIDVNKEVLQKAMKAIKKGPFGLVRLVEKGRLESDQIDEVLERIKATTNYDEFSNEVDIVIEAIPEKPELKKRIFNLLDEKCPEKTVFASNTSGIMITELAESVNRKEKFVGMHWFNPAPVMPLIEVIRGFVTSEETFELIIQISKKLGKIPIEVKDGPGFYTTRFIAAYLFEAIRLFEEGIARLAGIDEMTKLAFRHPMGPFELMDLIGLDTMLHLGEYIFEITREPRYHPPLTLRKLVLSGYLGDPRFKPGSKGGWHDYFEHAKP